ncbi:lysosomal Pro-X carboxypeptidase-like [Trifolium pratense]|uniref:lysosomal Pro-X carboxypeptidase-like n=1 Tax=Trifolium pratense TaxID=57577 RepID=UPI001E6953B5|nr:lysosomal Pro-X carboxypeptidase-like [Trifolium pratense]
MAELIFRLENNQRYFVNYKYWGGANSSAPILVYLGAETEIYPYVGFMTDNAISLNALLVYIEHRYYGKSVPFQSREAYKNTSTLGYFNSAQALADYAAVLIHLKDILQAQKSPVIVIGESYGGMLAAWFRLKYPHITIGALASSAPLLYFDNMTPQTAYHDTVTRDFKETSESCYKYILNSWSEIDQVASQPSGLSILSQRFNTCYPLEQSKELKRYLEYIYTFSAQFDIFPVTDLCEAIDGAAFGSDILSRIYGGVVAFHGNSTCTVNSDKYTVTDQDAYFGWRWQTCSEMVMPIGSDNSSMFEPQPFNFTSFAAQCKRDFGVLPRRHWITTYYGGQHIELVLKRFSSNIIFSNGLRDPWSRGGVLNNISDTLVALTTANGTHCMDLESANENDPEWLVYQRKKEVDIIHGWIRQYYADLDDALNGPKSDIAGLW